MLTTIQSLEAQKTLLDIQCTAQFASKNIQEPFCSDNVVLDLYSLIEKLHLILGVPEKKTTPESRG